MASTNNFLNIFQLGEWGGGGYKIPENILVRQCKLRDLYLFASDYVIYEQPLILLWADFGNTVSGWTW